MKATAAIYRTTDNQQPRAPNSLCVHYLMVKGVLAVTIYVIYVDTGMKC